MAKSKLRTFRVKAGYGPHHIPDSSGRGKSILVRSGQAFRAYGHERYVVRWAHKLEEIVMGGPIPVSVGPTEEEDAEDAIRDAIVPILEPLGGGWYNVINPTTGEKLNKKALRKEEAEAFSIDPGPGRGGSDENPAADDTDGDTNEEKTRRRRV